MIGHDAKKRRATSVAEAIALFVVGLLSACGGQNPSPSAPGLPVALPQRVGLPAHRSDRDPSNGKIKHIVIIVQENRSFNNLFYGYPGAKTVTHGIDSKNKRVKLIPVVLEIPWDINHGSSDFFAACNGTGSIPGTNCRMNGFDKELVSCGRLGGHCPNKHPQYAFVPHSETKPYFDMAKQYVLADRMYASNFDSSSFVSHQYIIAGQAQSSVDYPFGSAWGCPGGPNDQINDRRAAAPDTRRDGKSCAGIRRRWGTNSTPRESRGRTTRGGRSDTTAASGARIRPSSTFTKGGLEATTSSPRKRSSSTTSQTANCGASAG